MKQLLLSNVGTSKILWFCNVFCIIGSHPSKQDEHPDSLDNNESHNGITTGKNGLVEYEPNGNGGANMIDGNNIEINIQLTEDAEEGGGIGRNEAQLCISLFFALVSIIIWALSIRTALFIIW